MNAGSAGPAGDSQQGEQASRPQRDKESRPLADTTLFSTEAVARQTQAGTPRPQNPDPSSAGKSPRMSSVIPAELAGRFRIQKLLGRGGMASVYLALDVQLDRPVAIKIPQMNDDAGGTSIPRFFREARTAATLNHPNICPIYDVGQDGDTYFIAMGFIQGRALTDYIRSGKRQPDRQVAVVVRKVALALEHAHARGILHRDLKPANIMIDKRGEPIVMDFGLACRLDDNWETRLTQDGAVIGTPSYMSPEQIDHRSKVAPAADVYSLGVVLYELLTGQCPFTGSMVSVIGQVLHAQPKPIAELQPDVAPELAEICSRAMAKNVPDRYATMKDLAQALGAFLKGEASSSTALLGLQGASTVPDLQGIEALLAESPAAAGEPHWDPPLRPQAAAPKWSRRAVWGAAGGTAAVLTAAVCVVVAVGHNSNPPENGPSVPTSAVAAVNTQHADQNVSSAGGTAPAATGAASPATSGPEKSAAPSPVPPPVVESPQLPRPEAPPAEGADSAAQDEATPPSQSPVKHDLSAASGSQSPQPADDGHDAERNDADRHDSNGGKTGADAPQPPPVKSVPLPDEKSPHDAKGAPNRAGAGKGKPGGQQGGRRLFGREELPPPPGPDPADIDSPEALKKYFDEADHNRDGKLDPSEAPMHILHRAVKTPNRGATYADLERAYKRLGAKLFDPPTADEMRKLPKGPPRGGPGGPRGPGGAPPPFGKPPGSA